MKRPTRETERMALVLMGTGPDGRQLYRPITPGALAMLRDTDQEQAGARRAGKTLTTPARSISRPRREWPTWFLLSVLALLVVLIGAVVVGAWLALTWFFAHILQIIGCMIVFAALVRLFAPRAITVIQKVIIQ